MKCFACAALGSLLVFAGIEDVFARQSSAPAPSTVTLDPVKLPAETVFETVFLARLSTNVDGRQCKPGDPVEAEVKQDIGKGHDVLLKKGSVVRGRIAGVQAPTSDKPQLTVVIALDTVRTKDGKQFSLNVGIQALAPEADVTNNDTLSDGRGLDAATQNAAINGHNTTLKGSSIKLNTASTGVINLPDLWLGDQIINGVKHSVLISSTGDFRLKKGAQLVLKMVSQ